MAVMMIANVAGQTPEGYERMLGVVGGALSRAPGFLMHTSHPSEGGWQVIEIWRSQEDAAQFFAAHIASSLPEGIRPKLTFVPLHDMLHPAAKAEA